MIHIHSKKMINKFIRTSWRTSAYTEAHDARRATTVDKNFMVDQERGRKRRRKDDGLLVQEVKEMSEDVNAKNRP
jgi:hypothetical protein